MLAHADAEAGAGRQGAAFVLYGQVLAADAQNIGGLKGAGRALLAMRRLDDSAETWRVALSVAPDDPEVLFQCGIIHFRRGEMDFAKEFFQRALAVEPTLYGARGMNLLAMLYSDDREFEALRYVQEDWASQRPAQPAALFKTDDIDPDRPLRIGYVSSDFRAHSVGFNMLPVYQRLDRNKFQIYSYAEVARPDAATQLFEDASDVWRSTIGQSDADVARTIAEDSIDILVILAAHLDENRPYIARFRPAPIQVSHHDICTSALDEIDYFIGDRIVTPSGGSEWFSERVLRLPAFTVHSIPAEANRPGPLPALENGFVTFGSFSAPQKISAQCIENWTAILHAIPRSRLILKHFEAYSEAATREHVLGQFASQGLGADRVSLIDTVDLRSDHLRAYERIDIALDPFPFGGATTTFEALLMGVPVVSLAGDRFVARCSAATLDAAGLSACVAHNNDTYVACAVELASNIDRLAALRTGLRTAVTASRACDANKYVRNLARIYRAIWRKWCFTKSESD